MFGEVANNHVAELTDVSPREFWMLMVLAVAVLIVGVWPAPLVDRMDASIGQLLIHVGQPKLRRRDVDDLDVAGLRDLDDLSHGSVGSRLPLLVAAGAWGMDAAATAATA